MKFCGKLPWSRLAFCWLGLSVVALAADKPGSSGGGFSALLPKAFQSNPKLEMTVFTEMAEAGEQLPEVSPAEPMYYVPHSEGFRPMGEAVAGEKPPMPAELERYMFQALENRGFRRATEVAHPPRLALIYYWGSHSALDRDTARQFPERWRRDVLERASLVGGKNFVKDVARTIDHGAGARDQTPEKQNLMVQAGEDIYYVVVSAYLFDDLAKNVRRLAWRTTMTVTAYGVAMRTAMEPLVFSAGDYFGRSTPEAIAIRRNVKDGTVKLAPLEVLGVDRTSPRKK